MLPENTRLILYGKERESLFTGIIKKIPLVPIQGLTPHLIGNIQHVGENVFFVSVCGVEGCGWTYQGDTTKVSCSGEIFREPKFQIIKKEVLVFSREEFEDLIESSSLEIKEYMYEIYPYFML